MHLSFPTIEFHPLFLVSGFLPCLFPRRNYWRRSSVIMQGCAQHSSCFAPQTLLRKECPVLLTITCEAEQATDLGYLLYKNPANVFQEETGFGSVTVFYPEATPERCTVALLLEIDPIGLIRGGK